MRIVIFFNLIYLCFAVALGQNQLSGNIKIKNLAQLSKQYQQQFDNDYREAVQVAWQKGWPIKKEFAGATVIEIMQLAQNGMPLYQITENLTAAKTVSTHHLWPGGLAALNLTGAGMVLGLWDGGAVLVSHQEFNGRVRQMDGATGTIKHSTHVAGTLIATGIDSNARGMASEATLHAFDWNYDISEMAQAADAGLLLSNHPYGYITGWSWNFFNDNRWVWFGDTEISQTEDYFFGFYSQFTQSWDQIAHNAPYYLIVTAAGNDRSQIGPEFGEVYWVWDAAQNDWVTDTTYRKPDGDYDCLPTRKVAKNILTVGFVYDLPAGYNQPSDVQMGPSSSWGPADDGRIKPDLMGNGQSLYSTSNSGNTSYSYFSGTSMASANVCGSLILLQQQYQNTHNNKSMRAATLKALVIHSADETGMADGPDYQYGWGLLNSSTAAKIISEDGIDQLIEEAILANGEEYSIQVTTIGTRPLSATICWTDPPATPPLPSLDPSQKMLVNDLDLRIKSDRGTVFFPYTLDPAKPDAAATRSDNNTDNVEKVYVAAPTPGSYVITVTHKGELLGEQQPFSLIVSNASLVTPHLSVPTNLKAVALDDGVHLSWYGPGQATVLELGYDDGSADTCWSFESPDGNQFVAVGFAHPYEYTINYASLFLKNSQGQEVSMSVYLTGENNGLPDLNNIFARSILLSPAAANYGFWYHVDFPEPAMAAGRGFFLIIQIANNISASIGTDASNPDGMSWYTEDSGHSWHRATDRDWMFRATITTANSTGAIVSAAINPLGSKNLIIHKRESMPTDFNSKNNQITNTNEISNYKNFPAYNYFMQLVAGKLSPFDQSGRIFDYYTIYRSRYHGGPYNAIGTTTVENYTDTISSIAKEYQYYVVTAVYSNPAGESNFSNEAFVYPDNPGYPQPLNLSAFGLDNRVELSWQTPQKDGQNGMVDHYNIYRSNVSGALYNFIGHSTREFFLDQAVVNDSTYYYVVTAVYNPPAGESVYSNEAMATPAKQVKPVPVNLIAGTGFDSLVPISWDPPGDIIIHDPEQAVKIKSISSYLSFPDGMLLKNSYGNRVDLGNSAAILNSVRDTLVYYKVYKSTVPAGPYQLVSQVRPTSRPYGDNEDYIDDGVVNDSIYFYVVTAVYTDSSESNYSNEVFARPAESGINLDLNYATTIPTINGIISAQEWGDARITHLSCPNTELPITLYLKNDADCLYLAAEVPHHSHQIYVKMLGIYFDDDNNETWDPSAPSSEGSFFIILKSDTVLTEFRPIHGNYPDGLAFENTIVTPAGVTSGVSESNYHLQYEVLMDLNTSVFTGAPGVRAGLWVFHYDQGQVNDSCSGFNGTWPVGTIWTAPKTYGKISLARKPDQNQPPEIICMLPTLVFSEDASLTFLIAGWYPFVEDPDNPDSTLTFIVRPGLFVGAVKHFDSYVFKARPDFFGTDSLQLIVSDLEYADSAKFLALVLPVNDPPEIIEFPDTVRFSSDSSKEIIMKAYAKDRDSPASLLKWQFYPGNQALHCQYDSTTTRLTLTAPGFTGSVDLICMLTDDSLASTLDTMVVIITVPGGIGSLTPAIPGEHILYQNYPNPYNSTTQIRFGLPVPGHIKLEVYNALGAKIAMLFDGFKSAGYHMLTFEPMHMANGVYFYRLQTGQFTAVKKMLLMK